MALRSSLSTDGVQFSRYTRANATQRARIIGEKAKRNCKISQRSALDETAPAVKNWGTSRHGVEDATVENSCRDITNERTFHSYEILADVANQSSSLHACTVYVAQLSGGKSEWKNASN